MNNYTAILIECDNSRSLGGSCERDLFNIYSKLTSNKVPMQNIYILSNNINYFVTDMKVRLS